MDKEIIEKFLLEISTPTGLTYSGDTTICNDEVKYIMNYINDLEQQCKKQKEIIDETINAIDLVIELIKQQLTEDDRWILDRLNGFKIILECKEVSE